MNDNAKRLSGAAKLADLWIHFREGKETYCLSYDEAEACGFGLIAAPNGVVLSFNGGVFTLVA